MSLALCESDQFALSTFSVCFLMFSEIRYISEFYSSLYKENKDKLQNIPWTIETNEILHYNVCVKVTVL